jgi:flagellar hook-basal body complex protein FliE
MTASGDPMGKLHEAMRVMADMAAGAPAPSQAAAPGMPDFQQLLVQAVRNVNEAQNVAQAKVQAFSTGQSNLTLEEVMLSAQKANLSLQGMIAVRNRLVDAYKDITNLPV